MSEKFLNKYRIQSTRLQSWDYGNDGAYFITICTNDRVHYFGEISGGTMILNGAGKLAERFWNDIPNHFPFIELDNFIIMPNHVHGILIINREKVTRYDNITGNHTGDATGDVNTMGNGNAMGNGITMENGITMGNVNTMGNGNAMGNGNTMGNGNAMGNVNAIGNGNAMGNGNTMGNVNAMGNVETRLIASLQSQSPCIPQSQPQSQPEKHGGFAGNKNPMFHRNISRIIRWYKGRCSFEIKKTHPVFAWQPRFYEHIIRDAAGCERIRRYITNNPANW